MSSSLILTNCLFCGFAALLLLPALKIPNILTYNRGIPIFFIVIFIAGKMLIPYEFPFTYTLASKNILPAIKEIENLKFLNSIKLGNIFYFVWLFIAVLLLIHTFFRHWKLIRILSLVPETKIDKVVQIILEICKQKQIKNRPKVIQLNFNTGPFIVGLKNPTIVLPLDLSEDEIRFIFMHEYEHFKNHHILIKSCIEILAAIYWWNPITWLLRKEVICALEIHADTNVIRALYNNKASLAYLEALINISKKMQKKNNTYLALSFALQNNMIKYRICTALKYECSQKNIKTSLFSFFPLILSICLLLFTFAYTFESHNVSPAKVEGTFTVDSKTGYFILREDMLYDLYINGEYVITIPNIPNDLSQLPVHK